MTTPTRSLFLLGGYDLEMLTVKQMLKGRAGCVVADKHLQWDNALLSAYKEELSQGGYEEVYGIELREDIPAPDNYHRIDHHNDWADRPSSLEQVAELLGVTPDRRQLLVAANDRGYIPAMKAMGASPEEIDDIRRRDRAAQGVTKEDELLAERAIKENLQTFGGIIVVKAFPSCFSPICDRLYPYRRLLIYNDSEWVFYGEGKADLTEEFAAEISAGRMYHGGGPTEYIGAARGAFSVQEILNIVTLITQRYEHL